MIKNLFEDFAYSEKCDIAGAMASITAAGMQLISDEMTNVFNMRNVEKTNEANISMNDATNDANIAMNNATNESNERMNAENNATQKALADEAYRRSTASNQLQELINAGFSPMQAKQIIAGTGATASMPMPTTTAATATAPTLTPGHADAFQAAAPNLSGLSAAASSIAGDLDRPDGGAIGQWLYNDAMNVFNDIPGFDPLKFNSFAELKRYAFERVDDPDNSGSTKFAHPEFAAAFDDPKVKRMDRSILGVKAFNNAHGEYLQNANETIGLARNKVQLSVDQITAMREQLDLEDRELIRDLDNELTLEKFKSQLKTFYLRPENNEKYLQKSLQLLFSNLDNQKLYALSQNIMLKDQYKNLRNRPEFASMLALYDLYSQVGVTSTEVGAAIAALDANGIEVLPVLRAAINPIVNTASGFVGDLVEPVVGAIGDAGHALIEGIKDPKGAWNANQMQFKKLDDYLENKFKQGWQKVVDANMQRNLRALQRAHDNKKD